MKRFIQLLTNSYNTLRSQHPIVNSLLIGTVLARAASSMSMPFLAIYLSKTTSMSAVMIGLVIGAGSLAGMFGGFIGGALSDRFGRRVIMMTALFGWVVIPLSSRQIKKAMQPARADTQSVRAV